MEKDMMTKINKRYAIYGGCFQYDYHGIFEFASADEAMNYARELAIEDYEIYAGSHGILDYEECYEDCKGSGWFDTISENEIDDMVYNHYQDCINSQIKYNIVEVDATKDNKYYENLTEDEING
jgi:hypothetical protein